jgi:hypothetical protein
MEINQKYMLDKADVKNVVLKNGNRPGFILKMQIPYYRGVALSMVDDLFVKVNGQLFEKEQLVFSVDGFDYTWPMIETVTTLRWEYGTKATIYVPLDGGLTVTPVNRIEVGCAIRMSYGGPCRPCVAYVDVDPCKMDSITV